VLAGNRTRAGRAPHHHARGRRRVRDFALQPEVDFDVVDRLARSPPSAACRRAQVALAWLLHKPGVTAPIVGATKLGHLEDALAAEQLSLSEEEIAQARGAVRPAQPQPGSAI
jgi:aryl-alcohol dehydrogenase-like predicted oxidoreductase